MRKSLGLFLPDQSVGNVSDLHEPTVATACHLNASRGRNEDDVKINQAQPDNRD
ncbi:MAG TPA: hypothetical protein VMZ31_10395 [Phycisphaerae bacterium]|nr:hypothetical protein [Phycisphaerae bacterium]